MRKASLVLACILLFVAGMATTVGLQAGWSLLFPFSQWGEWEGWAISPLFGFGRTTYITIVLVILGMALFFFFSNKEKESK